MVRHARALLGSLRNTWMAAGILLLLIGLFVGCAAHSSQQNLLPTLKWKATDMNRPAPPVITPGTASTQTQVGQPPSDAIVLFNGRDLSKWQKNDGAPAGWTVQNGYLQVKPGTGSIFTKQKFGDVQLHLEWEEPVPAQGAGQGRGNSGIKFMGKYEVQVLDSYHSATYPDGQTGAVYGQYPPLVNADRPPGVWQMYDIVFRAPHFDADGNLTKPATVTVFQNGVLVQDHVVLVGPTGGTRHPYSAHPEKLPLMLQDHHNPVRYRNIWIRQLG